MYFKDENKSCKFINIENENKESYHIYFNDNDNEEKRYTIKKEEKLTKIKIILDYQIKSFAKLFLGCRYIKSINFKKFYRTDIADISYMFSGCKLLKEIIFQITIQKMLSI